MNPKGAPAPETRGRPEGTSSYGRVSRFLGLAPEVRLYPSHRWDVLVIVCGLLIVGLNLGAMAYGHSWHNVWTATSSLGLVLFALSDLLIDRGARWVVTLRAIANLVFASVLVMVVWAATGGEDLAISWLAGSGVALVFVWMLKASRANDRYDAITPDSDHSS